MRYFAAILLGLIGCGPGAGGAGGIPPGYNQSNCAPAGTPTLTALAFGHIDGRPYAVGDRFETATGGQGLTMAHFTLRLTGDVPACVQPSIMLNYDVDMDARATSAVADGATIEYYMGPIDLSEYITLTATVGDKVAKLGTNETVGSID